MIGSLFSGIGGLELGLEMAGLGPVVWQCETDPFCQRVLEKHWPGVTRYGDIRELTDPPPVDIICGGFPCQDISSAGKGAGLAGERSGLWFEFARIIDEARPRWVVVENVASGAKRWVDQVCSDLGQLGYEALPIPLSAADVGAPHLRRRIFIVAYSNSAPIREQSGRGKRASRKNKAKSRRYGKNRQMANPGNTHRNGKSTQSKHEEMARLQGMAGNPSPWAIAPEFRRVDDGIPNRVDRLRALGNAVVPQCAEVIGWVIQELSNGC